MNINIATVHWNDDSWIDIQLDYINRYYGDSARVYAFLTGISHQHRRKYHFCTEENIVSHPAKLNILADIILHESKDDDIILFLDGDAFPISPFSTTVLPLLSENPLIAVQRLENDGDLQPHPSFCVTTIKFWRDLQGDWNPGYQWPNTKGELVTDVGGELLRQLEQSKVAWRKLNRSNLFNLHPLWFGIYGNLVYHHGAGFRVPLSRHDLKKIDLILSNHRSYRLYSSLSNFGVSGRIKRILPIHKSRQQLISKCESENQAIIQSVYREIISNPKFFEKFLVRA